MNINVFEFNETIDFKTYITDEITDRLRREIRNLSEIHISNIVVICSLHLYNKLIHDFSDDVRWEYVNGVGRRVRHKFGFQIEPRANLIRENGLDGKTYVGYMIKTESKGD